MKVLFSLLWLLHFSPVSNPPGEPVVSAAPVTTQDCSPVTQPENTTRVRSMGTVIEYFEGNGIGVIKPQSGSNITVLVSDIEGRQTVKVNSIVSYIESNTPKKGRRATEVQVTKP